MVDIGSYPEFTSTINQLALLLMSLASCSALSFMNFV